MIIQKLADIFVLTNSWIKWACVIFKLRVSRRSKQWYIIFEFIS